MNATRDIITIDREKCTGCGLCVPNCPEGALQIIDGKARLVSDLFCDGLGACIGRCPEGAISIESRPAEPYDERRVMENIIPQGAATIRAHLEHLKGHGAFEYLSQALGYLKEHSIPIPALAPSPCAGGSCPGSAVRDLTSDAPKSVEQPVQTPQQSSKQVSQLRQWPVQIMLVPPQAPFFANADVLIAADCVAFALPDFHERLLAGRVLLVGCPKLDDAAFYQEKLTDIFTRNAIRSVTVAHMEVPCCSAMVRLTKAAIAASGKIIPFADVEVSIKGEIQTV
jgi:ferredoxin